MFSVLERCHAITQLSCRFSTAPVAGQGISLTTDQFEALVTAADDISAAAEAKDHSYCAQLGSKCEDSCVAATACQHACLQATSIPDASWAAHRPGSVRLPQQDAHMTANKPHPQLYSHSGHRIRLFCPFTTIGCHLIALQTHDLHACLVSAYPRPEVLAGEK